MFGWWGRTVARFRWVVLAAGLLLALVGVGWGTGLFGALTGGGFDDPASESARAQQRIVAELGEQGADLLVLYSSDRMTVDDPSFRATVTGVLGQLRQRPEVVSVVSWYDQPVPALVATDRHATYALIRLRAGGQGTKIPAFERIRTQLDAPGLRTEVGGVVAFQQAANEQSTEDITRAELLSMPVLLVLLALIFGGLVAAGTPLLIGGLAILGAFVAVRLITMVTEVSVFAINVITLIGLGMAIDYSLFVVSRFREEMAAGHAPAAAVERTMATAGRTVLVSGLTIAIALASLLIFPQSFLRSMGLGGMSAVLVAMLAALTVLPALLAVLGRRIDALRVPVPWRRHRSRHRAGVARDEAVVRRGAPTAPPTGYDPAAAPDGVSGWARIAHSVMRRPAGYVLVVLAVLGALAVPFLRIEFGGFDERVLPADTQARQVSERIAADFPGGTVAPVDVFVAGAPLGQLGQFSDEISRLPGVTGVSVAANRGEQSLLSVSYRGEPTGATAEAVVRSIRALPPPGAAEVLVGGRTAADVDLVDSLRDRLPWMALIMALATLVLLFLAFGSVLLPVKAVLMNLISIGASFGVVVWIFQDGHLADWLRFTPTGFIEPTNPILMLAVLFGLATDYEVFLLSRVREEWDRTGDNTASVAAGLQHTGRIITAAALLLIVVVAGFATGGIVLVKMIGIGMIVAVVLDATLVRVLLVPATMRLLGRWNWWAPGPLARIYRRYGIRESDDVPDPVVPAPREPAAVG
jgi:uncharacterized membrane protein YdfJ with MMPL/SSD domain